MSNDDFPMTNCQIIHRPGDTWIIKFDGNDPRATVNMHGYLICPVEMFSEEQINFAFRNYQAKAFP